MTTPKSRQKAMLSLPAFRFPPKKKDLPATQGMLQLVRTELKSDIRELRSEMKAEFSDMRAQFSNIGAQFSNIGAQFSNIGAEFAHMRADFSNMRGDFSSVKAETSRIDAKHEHVLSEVARIGVLVEEQNSNNRIVLEGLTGLWQRQEQVESVITEKVEYGVSAALGRTKT